MISVIIPVHNKGEFIKETLRSLRGVNDIEILVIDNLSTDDSMIICKEEATQNHAIRILKQDRPGVSATRNLGISKARGEYICFLDADDMYVGLDKMSQRIPNENADILVFGFQKFDDSTGKVLSEHSMKENGCIQSDKLGEWMRQAVETQIAYNVSNKIYRTDFLRSYGASFDETIDRLEDLVFFVNAFEKAKKITYTDLCHHLYRSNITDGSLVHRKRNNYDFLVKTVTNYRIMERTHVKQLSSQQIEALEDSLYLIITRELSLMRKNASIKDNRHYNHQIERALFSTNGEIKQHCRCNRRKSGVFRKYQIGIRFLLPLWCYTRLRWNR